MLSEKPIPGDCLWCGKYVTDRHEESGGVTPSWAVTGGLDDGDFGCNSSPESCFHGVGCHARPSDFVTVAFGAFNAIQYALAGYVTDDLAIEQLEYALGALSPFAMAHSDSDVQLERQTHETETDDHR